jgi:ATP-dependent helicase/nuclease subunit B
MAALGRRVDTVRTTRLLVTADAASRLTAAADWLDAQPADAEALVIAPGWEACDDLVRGALGPAGARFGVVRTTLARLAARLAAPHLAARGCVPVSELGLLAVAARAVHRLDAESVFTYFGPVADRPGFPRALARTLEELAMGGVTAEALGRLPNGGADLARLAGAVADELRRDGLADRAALYRAAVAAAASAPPPHPVGLPVLLLDLPLASEAEEALVAAVARRAAAVLATAVAGDASSVCRLERALGCDAERPVDTAGGSLAALQRHLFETAAPPEAPLDDGVVLTAWPGESRECVEISRAIQEEAARGVPFDRMAVLLHAPADYVGHLEEAFARAAIPYFFSRATRRPHPGGRALLALLACAAEGLSARRFAEYLSLAQVPDPARPTDPDAAWTPPESDLVVEPATAPLVPPEELVLDPDAAAVVSGSLRTPARWEQLLVEAAVIGGRDRWARRLDGLARDLARRRAVAADEQEAQARRLDDDLRALGHLRAFALPLIDRLAVFPRRATWGEWLEHLRGLATASLREPRPVLAALAELEPMAPVGPVELDEVQLVLSPRLRDVTEPPPRRRYGRVFVGTARSARGMAFDVVFVPGLAENLFPGKILEDPLLLDEQRRLLGAGTLVTEAERVEGERLALRVAAGAARRRVWLSYPRVDVEKARRRVPSFYALEVLKAAEGRLPGLDALTRGAEQAAGARLGWPAPAEPREAIDEAEYDLALLAPLLHADPETTAGTASYLLQANPHLARALRARGRRWLRRWTSADGLVDPDELARAALARHQMAVRSYSPTALQLFASCPYRFFLQAVHRLAPREDPVAIEVLDPLTRGALFHDVQFGILEHLRDAGLLPLRPDGLGQAFAALDAVLDAEAERAREALAPAIPRVWDDEIDALRADLREWLRRTAADEAGWVPERFELAFGLKADEREHSDPGSVSDPVPVGGPLVLRGSIDLVEGRADGALRVTDHKTGKAWAKDGVVVGGGTVLQPLLYALAAERILGKPVTAGRLYYCTATGEYAERVVPLDQLGREAVSKVVEVIDAALRQGLLPAMPQAGACSFCDYRRVCGPYEETRTQRKPLQRFEALRNLRSMP